MKFHWFVFCFEVFSKEHSLGVWGHLIEKNVGQKVTKLVSWTRGNGRFKRFNPLRLGEGYVLAGIGGQRHAQVHNLPEGKLMDYLIINLNGSES